MTLSTVYNKKMLVRGKCHANDGWVSIDSAQYNKKEKKIYIWECQNLLSSSDSQGSADECMCNTLILWWKTLNYEQV